MVKQKSVMQFAAEFKLPTAAITTSQCLGVLPRSLPSLGKMEAEDRHFLEAFSRCWKNSGFIAGGLAELPPAKREQLKGPRQRLQGWKAEANKQYEFLYQAEFSGYDFGETIREVTARLKKSLFLTPEQCGGLDAIRRAAKIRMHRQIEKDKREGNVC